MEIRAASALLILFVIILSVGAACPSLQIAPIQDVAVAKGSIGSFPIAVKNLAPGIQSVYVSANNPYMGSIDAYFGSSSATLAPSQEAVFTFYADTANGQPGTYSFPVEITADAGTGICSETLALALTVNAADLPPQASDSISALISPSVLLQKFPGESQEYSISVYNPLDEEIIAEIGAPSNPFEKTTVYSETVFRISAKGNKIVTATVTLPPATPSGDYDVVFKVKTTSSCCVQEFLLPVTLRSYSKTADLRISGLPSGCLSLKHDQTKSIPLSIRNYGEISGPFNLELTGNDEDIAPIEMPLKQFELIPGERTFFNITLSIPETQPVDVYRFKLKLRYLGFLLSENEICYSVQGISNVEVEKPMDVEVKRCTIGVLPFKVTNIGTLKDDYALEVKPLKNAAGSTEPSTFSLAPAESRKADLIIQTTCETPLGSQLASLVLRPKKASAQTITFEYKVVPSNASGQSFLKIDAPKTINLIAGTDKTYYVNILNTKRDDMPNVVLTIEGLSKNFYAVEAPKTIKTGKTAPYRIVFNAKTSGSYKVSFVATSGLEVSKMPAIITVEDLKPKIDYSYDVQPVREGSVAKEAIVVLKIRNSGNAPLQDLSVSSPASDVNLVQLDYVQKLDPGQTADMRVQVQPLQDTISKDIMLKISSLNGAVTAKPVSIPELKKVAVPEEFPWRILLIAILIILILWLLGKQTI